MISSTPLHTSSHHSIPTRSPLHKHKQHSQVTQQSAGCHIVRSKYDIITISPNNIPTTHVLPLILWSERYSKVRDIAAVEYYFTTVYLVPSDYPHLSEYVPAAYMRRAYLTDFHGSAGTAVVTKDKAYLWTDSRYVMLLFLGMCVLGWKTTHDSVSVYNEAYSSSHIAAIFPFHMQVFQRGIHPSRLGSLGPNEAGPTKGTHHQ